MSRRYAAAKPLTISEIRYALPGKSGSPDKAICSGPCRHRDDEFRQRELELATPYSAVLMGISVLQRTRTER